MKRAFLFPLLLLSSLLPPAIASDPRRDLHAGLRDYDRASYDSAAEAFRKAAAAAGSRLDAAVPRFNEGNALFRLRKPEDAAARYVDATRSPDLALQAKAYFNRGNALFAQGKTLEATGDSDGTLKALNEAAAMYENAMALDPGDRDSKFNYELTLRTIEEVEQRKQDRQKQEQDQQQGQDQQQEPKSGQGDDRQQQPPDDRQAEPQPEQDRQQVQPEPERPSEEMTPAEAQVLLDAMRQDEQANRDRLRLIIGEPVPVEKDW